MNLMMRLLASLFCVLCYNATVCFISPQHQPLASTNPSSNVGTITTNGTVQASSTMEPTNTDEETRLVLVSSSIQPTINAQCDGVFTTAGNSTQPTPNYIASVINSPTQTVGTTSPTSVITSPPQTVGTVITTGTVPVSSSTQPTNNLPSDGATTTSVIIVVAVVIILVVIVVGVVILVVLFRAKKRKQQLVINKLQNIMMECEDIELNLKQEDIEKKTYTNVDQPPYAEILRETPPNVPSKSEERVAYLNQNRPPTGGYSEIELEGADRKHELPAKLSRHATLSEPLPDNNPMYQDVDQHHGPPSTTNVLQGNDSYTVPDTTSSHTVEMQSGVESHNGNYETVKSEPIQPSLFTGLINCPSDTGNVQLYGPIYTIPINLQKSEKEPLKVVCSNIQEIHELGMGFFGEVVLAKTVGLSPKDLRLSESNDDKSKSTLVAVKKLKSDAPNAKEAFEKEVKFMSRLTDRNVIRILGVHQPA